MRPAKEIVFTDCRVDMVSVEFWLFDTVPTDSVETGNVLRDAITVPSDTTEL